MKEQLSKIREKILHLDGGSDFIEYEIELLFAIIAETSNINEAEIYFMILEEIQFALAKSIFKDGLEVSSFVREFVKDFDRIDDPDVQEHQYKILKSVHGSK